MSKTKNKKDNINSETIKKKWTKADYAEYYKESRELSDYTCSKNGVVENRYKKKN